MTTRLDRRQVIERLRDDAEAVRSCGATSLYVYGSVARDEAVTTSDIDLFIDYDPASRFNAFDLIGIKLMLEKHLETPVDITTRDGLHPQLKASIEASAVRGFLVVRDFRHALHDMNAAICGIQAVTAGKTLQDYSSDWMLKHALQRAIEIISEASRSLPEDVRATRPEIPWARVKTIGNVIRHEYHGLSDTILWGVIIDEIPRLERAISALLEQYPAE